MRSESEAGSVTAFTDDMAVLALGVDFFRVSELIFCDATSILSFLSSRTLSMVGSSRSG